MGYIMGLSEFNVFSFRWILWRITRAIRSNAKKHCLAFWERSRPEGDVVGFLRGNLKESSPGRLGFTLGKIMGITTRDP